MPYRSFYFFRYENSPYLHFCFLFGRSGFFTTGVAFSQNIEIIYGASVRQTLSDEARKNFESFEGGREQLKQNEEPEPSQYRMLISNEESSFTYIEKISNNQDPNAAIIKHAPGGFGTTYKNLSDSLIMMDFDVYGKKYVSKDSLVKFDWKLSKEQKEVLG